MAPEEEVKRYLSQENDKLREKLSRLESINAELLAACKEARRRANDGCGDPACISPTCVYTRMLDAAITKATEP